MTITEILMRILMRTMTRNKNKKLKILFSDPGFEKTVPYTVYIKKKSKGEN